MGETTDWVSAMLGARLFGAAVNRCGIIREEKPGEMVSGATTSRHSVTDATEATEATLRSHRSLLPFYPRSFPLDSQLPGHSSTKTTMPPGNYPT